MLRSRSSDADLLAKAQTSRRAFGMFYDRYEQVVAGYFMRRTRDVEVTADLTAEVFAAAFAAAGRYRPTSETAAPWLFTIAHNTLVSSVRRGRVEERARRELGVRTAVEVDVHSAVQLEHTILGDVWVTDLLDRLPVDQREAVRARVLEDRSYDEIAVRLDTSSLVIRKRVSRGLASLRQELEGRS